MCLSNWPCKGFWQILARFVQRSRGHLDIWLAFQFLLTWDSPDGIWLGCMVPERSDCLTLSQYPHRLVYAWCSNMNWIHSGEKRSRVIWRCWFSSWLLEAVGRSFGIGGFEVFHRMYISGSHAYARTVTLPLVAPRHVRFNLVGEPLTWRREYVEDHS